MNALSIPMTRRRMFEECPACGSDTKMTGNSLTPIALGRYASTLEDAIYDCGAEVEWTAKGNRFRWRIGCRNAMPRLESRDD